MNKILVIGSLNTDYSIKLNRLPNTGETVGNGKTICAEGGKGANQALAAARSGGNVIFCACVGNNDFSELRMQKLVSEGIDTRYLFKIDNVDSGSAFILVDRNGENMIAVAPGANDMFTKERVIEALPAFDESEYIVLQLEIPLDTVKYIIDLAYEKNKKIILNAAPAKIIEDKYLKKIHLLIVNETEAAILTDISSIVNLDQAKEAGKELIKKGPENVIITRGINGSLVINKDFDCFDLPAYNVVAVDVTAAGDTYCGVLAVKLSEGKSIIDAVRFATAASALTVTKNGAQPSIPQIIEINQFISDNKQL